MAGLISDALPGVIDSKTHGIIDYCHAAFFFGMAIFCARRNRPAAKATMARATPPPWLTATPTNRSAMSATSSPRAVT